MRMFENPPAEVDAHQFWLFKTGVVVFSPGCYVLVIQIWLIKSTVITGAGDQKVPDVWYRCKEWSP